MAKNKLGRGLSALLPDTSEISEVKSALQNININKIYTNPFQPRVIFKEESLLELSESIKENGLIQPIVVRKKGDEYELISGERRLRAVKLIGFSEIPAIIKDNVSDNESMVLALIENIQREDISPLEQAESYKKILEVNQITQNELAQMLGKSRPVIANAIRLLELSPNCKKALEQSLISEGHARKLLQLSSFKEQDEYLSEIINNAMTVREIETKIISKRNRVNKTIQSINVANNRYKISCKKELNNRGKFIINFRNEEEYSKLVGILEEI
jgi:ParB family transcriptional regulator, chromosome partitioning protein